MRTHGFGAHRRILALLASALIASGCTAGIYHTVHPGENLFRIGKAYDVPYQELAKINGIAQPDKIRAGQKLYIPGARRQLPVSIITPASADPSKPRELLRAAPGKQAANRPEPPPAKAANSATSLPARAPAPAARAGGEVSALGFSWPARGRISSAFGPRDRGHHDGIDIDAPSGAAVYAARDGKVIFSDKLNGYGNVIIVEHSGGFTTVYAHNERNLAKKGASVRRGGKIATVGHSGRSSGPHLHFEIRKNNIARNPIHYLPGA